MKRLLVDVEDDKVDAVRAVSRTVWTLANDGPGGMLQAKTDKHDGLFQHVPEGFTGHSGGRLYWKIECDALTSGDWQGLAWMVRERLYATHGFKGFRAAVGIPRGGTPFAAALNQHANPHADVVLLVDDVWTTGGSMRQWRARMQ